MALCPGGARAYAQVGGESSPTNRAETNQPATSSPVTAKDGLAAVQPPTDLKSPYKKPVFHHLTIDDGLSHNSVFHVLQDRQGFIWMTTVEGINRYDGMTMTTFMPQAEGSKSTPQFYYTMLEGRDGTLWFCDYGAGLVRYDPVHDTWKYYQHDEHNPNSLANDTLWWLYEDREGILWVSTFDGLSRFDPATEQLPTTFIILMIPTVWVARLRVSLFKMTMAAFGLVPSVADSINSTRLAASLPTTITIRTIHIA
ncbi:MAG: two-component regulator propeller domain-containing protein [Candidatus Thiodiazotropha sp.]